MTTNTPFEQAMREHGPTVLRVCRAVLGPGPDAEDAYAETFLAALHQWPCDVANVQAWLVRVAQRKAVDVTRARTRRAVPTADVPDRGATAETHDDELWHAVANLPERQRLAIAYHYLGGLPHTETAELIGGTPAAVRRASADGIRALRTALTERSTPLTEDPA